MTSAADRLPYFTGLGTASLATFSAFARTFIDDADAPTVRGTLGLGTLATQNTLTALADHGDLCAAGESVRRNPGDTANECYVPASGGEANVTADVGAGAVSLRGSTPKSGVALNLRTLNSSDFSVASDIVSVGGLLTRDAEWDTISEIEAATAVNILVSTELDSLAEFDAQIGITGTPSSTTFWRGDNTWATPAASGTVTATGGSLTANAVVLGAGGTDTKVIAGLTTDVSGNLTATSYTSVCTPSAGDCGSAMIDDTSEPGPPASGTLLYSLGGEVYKKDNGDSTNERLFFNSGNVVNPVTWAASGVTCDIACSSAFNGRACTDSFPAGGGGAAVLCSTSSGRRVCLCS